MLKKLLVPVDGSRFAESAVPPAVQLARAAGGSLHLVLVHHALPAWNPAISFPDGGAAIEAATRERETTYLAALTERVSRESGLEVSQTLVRGTPGEAIASHAAAIGAGLIVMASHGRGPVSRFWLGSTTDYVLRHVAVPVLVVHPLGDDPGAETASVPFRRILVPLDESPLSRMAVAPAEELARLFGAELVLLSVVEPVIGIMDPALPFPAAVDPATEQARQDQALAALADIVRGLQEGGVVARSVIVAALGVGASILEVRDREGADLIAMSTHGAGGLRRAFVGSVTDKVIRGSPVPVLAWRPPQES
ncbi:MAG: universal stress protein [Gemmatimonadota bacterium]|nr:universal stress protein [Gemmatimonadota bacterium]